MCGPGPHRQPSSPSLALSAPSQASSFDGPKRPHGRNRCCVVRTNAVMQAHGMSDQKGSDAVSSPAQRRIQRFRALLLGWVSKVKSLAGPSLAAWGVRSFNLLDAMIVTVGPPKGQSHSRTPLPNLFRDCDAGDRSGQRAWRPAPVAATPLPPHPCSWSSF
jgi:hypothetical protein